MVTHRRSRPMTIGLAEIARQVRLERRMLGSSPSGDTGDRWLRPRRRGECRGGPRPCPWLTCRYHLGVDVTPAGGLYMPFPDRQPWDVPETCALDVAERGGLLLREIGELLGGISRERVRQIQARALAKLREAITTAGGSR